MSQIQRHIETTLQIHHKPIDYLVARALILLNLVLKLLFKYFPQLPLDSSWLTHTLEFFCIFFVKLSLAFDNWAYFSRFCQFIKQCPIIIIIFEFLIICSHLNCGIESSNLPQLTLRYCCWQGKCGVALSRRIIIESQTLLEFLSFSL